MGHEAQRKVQSSNVLVVGLGGLGVEIGRLVAPPMWPSWSRCPVACVAPSPIHPCDDPTLSDDPTTPCCAVPATLWCCWLLPAKNIILAGVRSVTLFDRTPVEVSDLSWQAWLTVATVS